MAYARTTTVDTGPAGDTIVQGVTDLDTDLTAIYTNLNTHEALTETHGATGAVVGTTNTQTLTNKTLSAPTLTGTVTLSGATMTGGTYTSPTINTPTVVTPTVSGGTFTSPTITGTGAIAGVFTGNLTGNVTGNLTGNVTGNVTGNLTGNATGTTGTFSSSVVGGATEVRSERIKINSTGSGNRYAYIDFHGDDTYTEYGLRLIRDNTGENATSSLVHRGTGNLVINTTDAAPIIFQTTNTTRAVIAAAGTVSLASQPYFFATVSSLQMKVTGDNTAYNITGAIWTEIKDIGNCFSNGTFTAPVTGRYLFSGCVALANANCDTFYVYLITSNRTHTISSMSNTLSSTDLTFLTVPFCRIVDMDAADTAYLQVKTNLASPAKYTSVREGTIFYGYLLP
jgi:hypothetical protein